mmetsp:Transcript_21356/g.23898  ORF Transcript_21356/g.23898 Transcript_21356/m.23898 type:complete len:88 (+) Transcript_21356:54-317(+)
MKWLLEMPLRICNKKEYALASIYVVYVRRSQIFSFNQSPSPNAALLLMNVNVNFSTKRARNYRASEKLKIYNLEDKNTTYRWLFRNG